MFSLVHILVQLARPIIVMRYWCVDRLLLDNYDGMFHINARLINTTYNSHKSASIGQKPKAKQHKHVYRQRIREHGASYLLVQVVTTRQNVGYYFIQVGQLEQEIPLNTVFTCVITKNKIIMITPKKLHKIFTTACRHMCT